MSTSFTVRLDDETEHKLADLTQSGESRNTVIRYAVELAHRARLEDQMRRESAALLHNSEDLAEIGAVREAMGSGPASDGSPQIKSTRSKKPYAAC